MRMQMQTQQSRTVNQVTDLQQQLQLYSNTDSNSSSDTNTKPRTTRRKSQAYSSDASQTHQKPQVYSSDGSQTRRKSYSNSQSASNSNSTSINPRKPKTPPDLPHAQSSQVAQPKDTYTTLMSKAASHAASTADALAAFTADAADADALVQATKRQFMAAVKNKSSGVSNAMITTHRKWKEAEQASSNANRILPLLFDAARQAQIDAPENAPQNELDLSQQRKHKVYILTHFGLGQYYYQSRSECDFQVISYISGDTNRLTDQITNIFTESTRENRKIFIVCSSVSFQGTVRKPVMWNGRSYPDKRLVITPTTQVNISSVLNNAIRTFFTENNNAVLRNLVIVHETDDLSQVVYNVDDDRERVRSINNIIFRDRKTEYSQQMLGHWDLQGYKISKQSNRKATYAVQLVWDLDDQQRTLRLRNQEKMSYRIILRPPELKPGEVDLDSLWWFSAFNINAPACADGRIQQTTGTCWWNTTMNILLLTASTAALMVSKWNSLPDSEKTEIESTSLEFCPNQVMSLKFFLFILINQILVQEIHSRYWHLDFSTHGAFLTKNAINEREGVKQKSFVERFVELNRQPHEPMLVDEHEGGTAAEALKVILDKLFIRGADYNIATLTLHQAEIMQSAIKFAWRSPKETWGEATQHPPVMFFLTPMGIHSCQERVKVNGRIYLLVSSAVMFPKHVIAGLTCGSIKGAHDRYMYDSNNHIVRDRWPQGDTSNYTKLAGGSTVLYMNQPMDEATNLGMEFLVYDRMTA